MFIGNDRCEGREMRSGCDGCQHQDLVGVCRHRAWAREAGDWDDGPDGNIGWAEVPLSWCWTPSGCLQVVAEAEG